MKANRNGKLAALIAATGMTRKELADRSGVGYVSLSKIVNRRQRPRADLALRLAQSLGVTVEETGVEVYDGNPWGAT